MSAWAIDELRSIFALAQDASLRAQADCQAPMAWAVCGAGKQGLKAAAILRAAGREVACFIDAKAQPGARAADGTPCFAKENAPAHFKSLPILVAIHNPNHSSWQAKQELIEAGFGRPFLLQEAVEAFDRLSHFWLAPAQRSLGQKEQAEAGLALLVDDQSKRAFLDVLKFRLLGRACRQPEERQYFPASVPAAPSPLRLIDCGAFDGDTLDSTQTLGIFPQWFAAFEPDPANYQRLAAKHAGRGMLIPCAVSDRMGMANFLPDGPSGALADGGEAIHVQMGSLDQMLGASEPNFIKMDIEGAELDALDGARALISRHQPRLAIACYHDPAHLWQVALKCREVGFQGQFMLRILARNTFDVVAYGIEPDA